MRRERRGRSAASLDSTKRGGRHGGDHREPRREEPRSNVIDISTGAPVSDAMAPTSPDAPPAETLPEMLPDTPPTEPEELPTTEPDAPISAEKPKLSLLEWLAIGSFAFSLWRFLKK